MDFPRLDGADVIAVDCETRDDDLTEKGVGAVREGYIVGVALATRDQQWYFPIAHEGGGNLDRSATLKWLNEVLSTDTPKIGANLSYDVTYLWSEGVQIRGPFWDIQVAEPLLDENKFSYSLETLAQERLGVGKDEDAMCEYIRQHFGAKAGKEKSYIWKCPAHIVAPYAKQDVALPIQIFDQQIKELREQELEDLFNMETDLLPVLVMMHLNGVRVDASYADQLSSEWSQHLKELESQFNGLNPGSSAQLAAYLDSLGVQYPRHSPTKAMLNKGVTTGNPKLDAKVLASLEDRAPLLKTIAEAKKYRHFLGTFINGYIVDSQINGRVHGQFNQLKGDEYGTVTGRLCIGKGSIVKTDRGCITIPTVQVGDKVLSHKGNWQDVSAVIFKGVEELFEVTLEDGRSIHCTKEHRFLTNNGWKHLRELSVGDDILTEEELHTRERRLRENNRN